jgi:hypothetical protein
MVGKGINISTSTKQIDVAVSAWFESRSRHQYPGGFEVVFLISPIPG